MNLKVVLEIVVKDTKACIAKEATKQKYGIS